MSEGRKSFWHADLRTVSVNPVECSNPIKAGPHTHWHCHNAGLLLEQEVDLFKTKEEAIERVRYVITQHYAQALVQLLKLKEL